MFVIIGIFWFFVAWDFLTRRYLNPYKLIMVFGKKGSGKTTTLTSLAIHAIRNGQKVYSTVEIPGVTVFNPELIGKYTFEPESLILIDEVGMIWDNRDYKGFKPEVRDFFKLQRQYKLTVYLFSQAFDIDKKLRDLTDEMYLMQNWCRVFAVRKRIDKYITISNGDSNSSGTSQLIDAYQFGFPVFSWKFTFIPRYVAYFKSFNPKELKVITNKPIPFNEVQERYLDTKKWLFDNIKIGFIQVVDFVRCKLFHVKQWVIDKWRLRR